MNVKVTITVLVLGISAPAIAEKPEWAGKGKPTREQVEEHREKMKSKSGDYRKGYDDDRERMTEDYKKSKEDKNKEKMKQEKKDKEQRLKDKAKKSNDDDDSYEGEHQREKSENKGRKWWQLWGDNS